LVESGERRFNNGSMAHDDPKALYLAHADLADRILASLARCRRLSEDEAEEFAAHVKASFVEDGYAVFRSFQGKNGCSLRTYLTTTLSRKLIDWQRSVWGKWRPSAAAERAGTEAVLLERLTTRDGFSFDEAAEMMRRNHGVRMSVAELAELAGRLPPKTPRRLEGEEALDPLPSPRPSPEAEAIEDERMQRLAELGRALQEAIAELPAEDWLIFRLRVLEGNKVVSIARAIRAPAKPLYRRIEQIKGEMVRKLEVRGYPREVVLERLNGKKRSGGRL
jgi:RNA polymerase sigma factor (sigma-70 family)